MTEPKKTNWIELAKIVSARIASRRDLEWKLTLQHFGAVAGTLVLASDKLRPFIQSDNQPIIVGTIVAGGIISFGLSILWNTLIQDAHGFDAVMYRFYMDKENDTETETVIEVEEARRKYKAALEAAQGQKVLPKLIFRPRDEQCYWFVVHFLFSLIVHIVVAATLVSIALGPKPS